MFCALDASRFTEIKISRVALSLAIMNNFTFWVWWFKFCKKWSNLVLIVALWFQLDIEHRKGLILCLASWYSIYWNIYEYSIYFLYLQFLFWCQIRWIYLRIILKLFSCFNYIWNSVSLFLSSFIIDISNGALEWILTCLLFIIFIS